MVSTHGSSLGTRRICERTFYFLWHMCLAPLPFRGISSRHYKTVYLNWCGCNMLTVRSERLEGIFLNNQDGCCCLWKRAWLFPEAFWCLLVDNTPRKLKMNLEVSECYTFANWSGYVRLRDSLILFKKAHQITISPHAHCCSCCCHSFFVWTQFENNF